MMAGLEIQTSYNAFFGRAADPEGSVRGHGGSPLAGGTCPVRGRERGTNSFVDGTGFVQT